MPEEPTETPTVIYPDNGKSRSNAVAMVTLLDGELLEIHLDRKAKGEDILEKVAKKLELTEKDYFGLSFKDKTNRRTWLDLDKRASKILKGDPWKLDFEVKFYPKDPSQLQEDLTRYLLCLQVRNDILSGKLPCSFVTYAMLGSYLVQSQLGDYSAEEYPDASYLSGFKFSPRPEPGLEEKVMSLHKGHKGQTPADAELHYLENAKKLTLYGVDMHPAKDSENVDIQLGVCSTGILVYQDMLRMNRFAWPKILKISYRRNNFYIKIRPGEFEQYEQTVVFKLDSSRAAKNLWKVCVDQHTFFRLMSADATKRPAFPFIRIGSKYGIGNKRKTQAELMDIPKSDNKNFDRTYSLPRFSRSMDEIGGNRLAEDNKRGSTLPTRPIQTSPKKAEKQKPPGGVAVLPKEPFSKNKKELIDKDKESNGHRNEIDDDEKENRSEQLSKSPTTPTKQFKKDDSKKQSPGSLITDIFGSGKKEPKKTKGKDDEEKKKDAKTDKKKSRSKEKIAEAEKVPERKEKATEDEGKVNPYTKVYEYEEEAENSDRSPRIGGFSYEKGDTKSTTQEPKSPTTEGRKGVATAFNYAPGDINKLEDETGKKNIFSLFSKKSPKGKEDEKKSKTEDDKQSKAEEEKKSSKLDFLKPKSEEKKKKDTEGDSSSKKSPKDKTEDAKQSEDEKKSSKLDFLKPKSEEKKKKDTEGDSPSKKSPKDKTEDAKQSKEDEKKSSKLDFLKPKSDEKKKKDTEGDSSKSKSLKSQEDEKKSKTEEEKKSSKFLKPKDDKKDKPKPEEGEKKSKLGSLLKSKTEGKKKKAEDQDRSIEEKDRSQTEDFLEAERTVVGSGPRVVKTTTKSTMGLSDGTLTQNVEEKIEDMSTGEVNISTTVNTAEGLDNTKSPFITAVTTRTATTVEDIDKNERTSQVEEKTVARSTTQKGLRQEQRVVTQEVRATTVVNEPQIKKSGSQSSLSSDDSGTPIDGESATYWTDKPQGPIVETERVLYGPVSEEEEQSATNFTSLSDVIVSSQTITSKTRTVETLTYKTEKDGVVETRVEQKITIQSDGDPVDHDKALAEAIQEATAMNPDMRVEKIEIQQEQLP